MRESERYYQKRHWTIEGNGIAGNGSMKHAYMRDHPGNGCRLKYRAVQNAKSDPFSIRESEVNLKGCVPFAAKSLHVD